jgi:hypothetical protein
VTDGAERLRAIAVALARNGDFWLLERVVQLESGADFATAFDLPGDWRKLARLRRDERIRQIARTRFPNTSARELARIIERLPDLCREIGGRVTFDVVRAALASATPRNPPPNNGAFDHGTGSTICTTRDD